MPKDEASGETLVAWPLADVWVRLNAAGSLAGLRLARAGSDAGLSARSGASGSPAAADPPALEAVRKALAAFYESPCDCDASPWLEEPCVMNGDAFSRSVWREAARLPCGGAEASEAIAQRLGRPGAGRLVAEAALACPLPVLIPIHRVGGAFDGASCEQQALSRRLLEHEQEKLVRWWF